MATWGQAFLPLFWSVPESCSSNLLVKRLNRPRLGPATRLASEVVFVWSSASPAVKSCFGHFFAIQANKCRTAKDGHLALESFTSRVLMTMMLDQLWDRSLSSKSQTVSKYFSCVNLLVKFSWLFPFEKFIVFFSLFYRRRKKLRACTF